MILAFNSVLIDDFVNGFGTGVVGGGRDAGGSGGDASAGDEQNDDGESRGLTGRLDFESLTAVVGLPSGKVVLCSAASLLDMLSCFFHLVRRFWNQILT